MLLRAEDRDVKLRLDQFLSRHAQALADAAAENRGSIVPARSQLAKWIRDGRVKVGGRVVTKPGYALRLHQMVEVEVPQPEPTKVLPDASVRFDIIFEDAEVIVVNKPAGLTVHPGAGRKNATLVSGLLNHLGDNLQQIGDALRPGIVHRLDKDTSGLMVVAKTEASYRCLLKQFSPPRTIHRTYLALAAGKPGAHADSGVLEGAIGRNPRKRTEMKLLTAGGRAAVTYWRLLESFRFGALLELKLETGRTHQIRTHLRYFGAPILGDPLYGPKESLIPAALRLAVKSFGRQALHAWKLSFLHPETNAELTFEAVVPPDLAGLIKTLKCY